MVNPDNPYTKKQLAYYEADAKRKQMLSGNHEFHNKNPDYWNILVGDIDSSYLDKTGLDFGCGTGRNIMNMAEKFDRFDGVDISPGLVAQAQQRIIDAGYESKATAMVCDGVSLSIIDDEKYDFVMSTITLQHICVYDIRFNILKEFYRVMKSGGLLSIQMTIKKFKNSNYFANDYNASGMNGNHDVVVTSESQVTSDLENIGFTNVSHVISDSPHGKTYPQWLFTKAIKP